MASGRRPRLLRENPFVRYAMLSMCQGSCRLTGPQAPLVTVYSEIFLSGWSRIRGPARDDAMAQSAEVGVPQSTLSRWLGSAGMVPRPMAMSDELQAGRAVAEAAIGMERRGEVGADRRGGGSPTGRTWRVPAPQAASVHVSGTADRHVEPRRDEWYPLFGDALLACAAIDRLRHNAHVVTLAGDLPMPFPGSLGAGASWIGVE